MNNCRSGKSYFFSPGLFGFENPVAPPLAISFIPRSDGGIFGGRGACCGTAVGWVGSGVAFSFDIKTPFSEMLD